LNSAVFQDSGLKEADLERYIGQAQKLAGGKGYGASGGGSGGPIPVYARPLPYHGRSGFFGGTPYGAAVIPLTAGTAGGQDTGYIPGRDAGISLWDGSTGYMGPEAEGPVGNGPGADKSFSAVSAQGAPFSVSTVMTGPAEGRSTGRDAELERLRKIEANYEHDKAALAKEKAPALARSDSHDVGHAEGEERYVEEKRNINEMTHEFMGLISEILRGNNI
jgi:hypothetical protein